MRVIPAIDLRGGLCVRLRQGDYERETVFGDDPAAMAARWEAEGATLIHLVDLDGAKAGRPVNVEPVQRIIRQVSVPCQLGGGVRDQATIATWLEAGIERVIVGTAALRDPDWFGAMIRAYPGRLVLGLDARDGKVAAQGWLETSSVQVAALARRFEDLPLAAIVYTDIARDGTLDGPNLEATRSLAEHVSLPVIASGGVGSLEDLERLASLPIAGCIVGRALYEGRFSLGEAIARVEAHSSCT
jgi:phosphoribosylformimino-5-aminoimidazole carboxamide ribotide isomerase